MAPLRVLVVEDSLTVRGRLRDLFAADPTLELIGEAEDGKRAIELCQTLRPDVVTMDMMLPVMSGLAATEYIMAHCPTPILIVSSSTNRGELFKTYEALAAGAVDVLEKPSAGDDDGVWERRFVATLKLVARIRVITHPRASLARLAHTFADVQPRKPSPSTLSRRRYQVVAIGASTGGPGAIVEILRTLPVPFPLPILLVLHIGAPFAIALAEWLDGQTGTRVSYARDGDAVSIRAGQLIMAPPESHMVVKGGRVHLTQDPPRHSCRPSVDALFESIAQEYGASAVAAVLTGMGRDGAAGLRLVRQRGGFTIGQDEDSSVVYGMPREANLLGAVERELPLAEIGPALGALAALCGEGSPS